MRTITKGIGCLIIHGFGGNVGEISPLADYLSEMGYVTYCPELKGHTGSKKDLAQVCYSDWVKSAEDGLLKLKAKCEHVVLIGFSMGGLIAANLAVKYPVEAMVTLNTPIYYWDFKRVALNIIKDIKLRKFDNTKRYIKGTFKLPVSAMINFNTLLKKTKPVFQKINCPVFIAQALEDDTVRYTSAEYIYRNVESQNKVIRYYKDCGHLICRSAACREMFADVGEFLQKQLRIEN